MGIAIADQKAKAAMALSTGDEEDSRTLWQAAAHTNKANIAMPTSIIVRMYIHLFISGERQRSG